MAKTNRMAEEAQEDKAALLAKRTYVLEPTAWDTQEGDEFGGKSEILLMEVGDICGPFDYVGHQQMTTSLGETTVHKGMDENGDILRLPIQATFLRAVDEAALQRGDTFIVKRFEDQIKKQGKGKGEPMAIYAVKVTKRGPVKAQP